MERRINLHLRISYEPRVLRPWLALCLLLVCAGELGSENVTLTTYYPAPSGMYTQMIVTGNTELARNSNAVNIGMSNATPSVKLVVADNSALKVGAAYLSSGGDYMHLANNEWYNNSTGWTATAQGVLMQFAGQAVNFYTHTAAGAHTPTVSISAVGTLHIGQTNATYCAPQSFVNGSTCGGLYATFIPGLYTEGWVYQNRGGAVMIEASNAGNFSTQVWGLDNCGAGAAVPGACTGNPRWMTLKKDDSITYGYCCTK